MLDAEPDGMMALNVVDERLRILYSTLPQNTRDPKVIQLRSLVEGVLQGHQTLRQMLPQIEAQMQGQGAYRPWTP